MNLAGIVALSVTIPLLLIAVVAIVYMAIVYRFRSKRHEAYHTRINAVGKTLIASYPNIITNPQKREKIKANLEEQYNKYGSLPQFVGTAQPPNVAPAYIAPRVTGWRRVVQALANY